MFDEKPFPYESISEAFKRRKLKISSQGFGKLEHSECDLSNITEINCEVFNISVNQLSRGLFHGDEYMYRNT